MSCRLRAAHERKNQIDFSLQACGGGRGYCFVRANKYSNFQINDAVGNFTTA
jgi:hypothetical protein